MEIEHEMDRGGNISLHPDRGGSLCAARHVSTNGDAGPRVYARCGLALLLGNRPPSWHSDANGLTQMTDH